MYAETRAETGLARMSPAVRAALGKVERHRLVPPAEVSRAYRNHPLPIGFGTIFLNDILIGNINQAGADGGTGADAALLRAPPAMSDAQLDGVKRSPRRKVKA